MCYHLLKDCHLQLSLSCLIDDIWTMSTRSSSLTQNRRMSSLYSECPSREDPIALSSFTANQPLLHLTFFSPTHFIPTSIPINLVKTPVISITMLPRPVGHSSALAVLDLSALTNAGDYSFILESSSLPGYLMLMVFFPFLS